MSRPDPKSGILVEIHQGGRLIAALPLGVEPIEVTLRDIRSGLPLGTLSAKGPSSGHIDETPMSRPVRAPEDDITMPFGQDQPVPRATGDLDARPSTPRPPKPRPGALADRKVPNLARSAWGHTTDSHLAGHAHRDHAPRRPRGIADDAPPDGRDRVTAPGVHPLGGARAPRDREETLSGMLEGVAPPLYRPPRSGRAPRRSGAARGA